MLNDEIDNFLIIEEGMTMAVDEGNPPKARREVSQNAIALLSKRY